MAAAYLEIAAINGQSKASQTPHNAARHNLRRIAAELQGRSGDRIDPARTRLNQVLYGPDTPEGIIDLMDETIEDHGAKVIRKDQIQMFEVVIDPHQALSPSDEILFYETAIRWLKSWFACPLLSAVIHRDEASPHAHLLFVPLKAGRLQGSTVMGDKSRLARMHKQFHAEVCKRFGFSGPVKLSKEDRALLAAAVLRHIECKGSLSADESFQLRKALCHASNLPAIATAFGLIVKEDPTTIGVGSTEPPSATPTFSVGVGVPVEDHDIKSVAPASVSERICMPKMSSLSPSTQGRPSNKLKVASMQRTQPNSVIPPPRR